MKRIVLLILVLLLACPVWAQNASELAPVIEEYMAEHGLNAQNFSMSYYNTVTGESYAFNDKKFMVAASTFKVPVNMYYYGSGRRDRTGCGTARCGCSFEQSPWAESGGIQQRGLHRDALCHR